MTKAQKHMKQPFDPYMYVRMYLYVYKEPINKLFLKSLFVVYIIYMEAWSQTDSLIKFLGM